MDKLYTCDEIAERYSVPIVTVWRWIREKKLPAMKIGKKYQVRQDDILQFENERRTV
ncbi:helix-turn-helix domain-containing protein [Scatolibacter rhodanostii]|uniref:helix-turn-helix domain-containing protein n=1 Tax=Scatolibacter rhodanostii TaxID=2014781 RepID=UPI000C06CE60|nr:helix-turn-helix domain-containing protein [Scatolibacter rhodanostii]